ncbi:MAG: transcription elongation factor GreA [Candidatus Omnitrophota bacterium]
MGGKGRISLTREGYNKLHKQLQHLRGEKRLQISRDIGEAREKGDLSENAEYDAAKEAQAHNEKRIADLENTLSSAQIIKKDEIKGDKVVLGVTVKVRDKNTGEEETYTLVSEEESDFDANKISAASPVGGALMGKKAGDIVDIKVPAGTLQYEILSIE